MSCQCAQALRDRRTGLNGCLLRFVGSDELGVGARTWGRGGVSIWEGEGMKLEERLTDIPCANCGHWIRLHGNGIGGCALDAPDAPFRCYCRKFNRPTVIEEKCARLIEEVLQR